MNTKEKQLSYHRTPETAAGTELEKRWPARRSEKRSVHVHERMRAFIAAESEQ